MARDYVFENFFSSPSLLLPPRDGNYFYREGTMRRNPSPLFTSSFISRRLPSLPLFLSLLSCAFLILSSPPVRLCAHILWRKRSSPPPLFLLLSSSSFSLSNFPLSPHNLSFAIPPSSAISSRWKIPSQRGAKARRGTPPLLSFSSSPHPCAHLWGRRRASPFLPRSLARARASA